MTLQKQATATKALCDILQRYTAALTALFSQFPSSATSLPALDVLLDLDCAYQQAADESSVNEIPNWIIQGYKNNTFKVLEYKKIIKYWKIRRL
jgi:hypothetical protein